jgi:hypothetical protein
MRVQGSLTLAAALAVALIASNLLWWLAYGHAGSAKVAAEAKVTALQGDIQRQRAEFEAEARRVEREQQGQLAVIRTVVAQELTDAQTKHHQVVAALRADALRLRQHWQGCAAPGLPAAAGAAAGADAAVELRIEDAGAFVRDAAECDATIRGLQHYARLCSGGRP